jgi:5-hydroxyisourate hydrolase-like protein (transthyretin family)
VAHTLQVKLEVYDIQGRLVSTLVNKELTSGKYQVEFNADNLSTGIYFYRLTTPEFVDLKKMMLVK